MTVLNIGDNIIRLRHEKKLTQEELASFIGVTKAAVSKWENNQSLPDITLLPPLATFFDVSVDELLGYEPQLNERQIRKLYMELAEEFVNSSFEEAFEKVTDMVKKFYNCYPFILYMCILMINHISLVKSPEQQETVLLQIQKWSDHIRDNSKVPAVTEDAVEVHIFVDFMLKKYPEVIEALRESINPFRMAQSNEILLVQSFVMSGDTDNTEKYGQTLIHDSLMNIIMCSILMLSIKMEDKNWCDDTISRLDSLVESYHLDDVNSNTTMQYYYQAAMVKAFYGEKDEAYGYLNRFVERGLNLVNHPEKLYEFDEYFQRVEEWAEESLLKASLPRDRSLIISDLAAMMEHPSLQRLSGEEEFERLKNRIKGEM
ncbi:MAG: helix-turn-helix transcriptional regulator [Eubacteriaceae bacterium]|nr:helix-turn-helix transcriptional regulator [Eubacteriaceae bacterium]